MPKPRVLVLRAPGTNCDHETEFAFELAGAEPRPLHVNRLLENPRHLLEHEILCIPGGFSYGDDLAAGRIFGMQLRQTLGSTVAEFLGKGRLILGICNGFQVLMKCGLLTDDAGGAHPKATLTWNASGKFEDRWVQLKTQSSPCVFLRGIEQLYLPIAHAEGQFTTVDAAAADQLIRQNQACLRYSDGAGDGSEDVPYPRNPNGSTRNIAGICDITGRVFGLMPHPERYLRRENHPRWTALDLPAEGDGLAIFRNAVREFS